MNVNHHMSILQFLIVPWNSMWWRILSDAPWWRSWDDLPKIPSPTHLPFAFTATELLHQCGNTNIISFSKENLGSDENITIAVPSKSEDHHTLHKGIVFTNSLRQSTWSFPTYVVTSWHRNLSLLPIYHTSDLWPSNKKGLGMISSWQMIDYIIHNQKCNYAFKYYASKSEWHTIEVFWWSIHNPHGRM